MKKQTTLILAILITALTIPNTLQAQFDKIITQFYAPIWAADQNIRGTVYRLGDQNDDGYDDFLIWNCRDTTIDIYFGGIPLDTIPYLKIPVKKGVDYIPDIAILDINNDNYMDIVYQVPTYSISYVYRKIYIYYGGPLLDIHADIIFGATQTNPKIVFNRMEVLKDYNGDGRNELAIYEQDSRSPSEEPDSNWLTRERMRLLIYNLGSEFDTLDYKVIKSPLDSLMLSPEYFKSGDLNNDGFTDFITGSSYTLGIEDSNFTVSRVFYGNNTGDFEADEYYNSKTSPIPRLGYTIIDDVNGDGADDILMRDYEKLFPYYYIWGISYGSDSLNFKINKGINTQNEGLYPTMVESGDYNGDGYGDFLSLSGSFYHNIKLWLGSPDMDALPVKTYNGTMYGIGRMAKNVGDVNGDGADDFCIGEVNFGGGGNWCKLSKLYIIAGDTSVVVSVKEETTSILPQSFELSEAYPNPFNPTTNITYMLRKEADVTIKIIDTLGKEITTLVKARKRAGKYEIEFNADKYGLSSGIYFITMSVNNSNNTITKKIVLMK